MSHYPNYTPAPKKKTKTPIWLVIAAALAVLAVCLCGAGVIANSGGKKPGTSAVSASAVRPTAVQSVAPSAQTTAAAATTPAAPKVPTIGEGTFTVGEDFPAGNYKVTGAGERCYWAIYTSGQNQSFDALIDNHLGGGNLRVTLKAGQDFETKRCGTWTKA